MMPAPSTVILVTGANRGIGLAIVQSLASHPQLRNAKLLLGCRDKTKGEAPVQEVRQTSLEINNFTIEPLQIDVTSDSSIRHAVEEVKSKHNRLDVLINNASYAMLTSMADFSDVREAFSSTYDTNVTSVAMTTSLFLPLLRQSSATSIGTSESEGRHSKVINISSARGSVARSVSGQLPPTASMAYSVSKTALNILTIEMSRQKINEDVEFQLACPGYCRTQFNGFRGTRDPIEGANVVTELVLSKERRELRPWETLGQSRDLVEVP